MKIPKKQQIKEWMKKRLAERDELMKKQHDAFKLADGKNAKKDVWIGVCVLGAFVVMIMFLFLRGATDIEAYEFYAIFCGVAGALAALGWFAWFSVRYVRFITKGAAKR